MAAPVNTVPPVISGTPTVGQTLTLTSNGTWIDDGSPTFTRRWQRDTGAGYFDTFPPATGTTFLLTDIDDTAAGIRCNVTNTDTGGATAAPSNGIGPIVEPPPAAINPPSTTTRGSVGGAFQIGRTVTYDPFNVSNMWTNMNGQSSLFSWQFQESSDGGVTWTDIPGAARLNSPSSTSLAYLIPPSQLGKRLRTKLTATNSGGSATAFTTTPFLPIVNVTSWKARYCFGSRDDSQPLASSTFGNNLNSCALNVVDGNSVWTCDDAAALVKKIGLAGNYVLTVSAVETGDCFNVGASPVNGDVVVCSNGHSWIARFNAAGVFQNHTGSNGTGPGQFKEPSCVRFFSDGSMLIGEDQGNRVQKFSSALVYQSLWMSGITYFAIAPDDTVWTQDGRHVTSAGTLIADYSANGVSLGAGGPWCDNGNPYRIYQNSGGGYIVVYDQTLTPVDYVGTLGSTGAPANPGTSTAATDQFSSDTYVYPQVHDGMMVVSDRFYNRVSVWVLTDGGTSVLSPPYVAGRGAC